MRPLPCGEPNGLARPSSRPAVCTPTPPISHRDGQVRERSGETPGGREGRDGLASPGHLHTAAAAAAAAALLAGSCMPSWAERSGGAPALLPGEGQPPGPPRAPRRAPPRPRLPGPSRPLGASATQAEGRGPQRRARLRQPEHCLTPVTVPPLFSCLEPCDDSVS